MTLRLLVALVALPLTAVAQKGWTTLEGCRLIDHPSNDGDSFHVLAAGKERIFRLYFVDCPETDAAFPERVSDQARALDLSVPETLATGRRAREFTRDFLRRPFTVITRWQNARGRSHLPRYFAFVLADGATPGEPSDLAAALLAKGLARRYGTEAAPPGARRVEQLLAIYQACESSGRIRRDPAVRPTVPPAHLARLQAAAVHAARHLEPVPLPTGDLIPAESPAPNRPRTAELAPRRPEKSASDAAGPGIPINTASPALLQELPGVGPKLAGLIVRNRPYQSLADLRRVPGLGEKRVAAFSGRVRFE